MLRNGREQLIIDGESEWDRPCKGSMETNDTQGYNTSWQIAINMRHSCHTTLGKQANFHRSLSPLSDKQINGIFNLILREYRIDV